MSTPAESSNDLHARTLHDLASLALGEAVDPAVAEHARDCAYCRRELDAYRQVIDVARSGGRVDDQAEEPPPRVWNGVLAALGDDAPRDVAPPSQAPADDEVGRRRAAHRPRGLGRIALVAAAVVAIAGAGVGGWAIGRSESGSSPNRSSQAVLAAQPGTSAHVHGRAIVHRSADGYTLRVTADGLPAPEGYYEVWLYNPSINQMVAVGTLGSGWQGTFTVPGGIDLRAYHVVDVSAQKYDGNNTHERSVLRGPLAP